MDTSMASFGVLCHEVQLSAMPNKQFMVEHLEKSICCISENATVHYTLYLMKIMAVKLTEASWMWCISIKTGSGPCCICLWWLIFCVAKDWGWRQYWFSFSAMCHICALLVGVSVWPLGMGIQWKKWFGALMKVDNVKTWHDHKLSKLSEDNVQWGKRE